MQLEIDVADLEGVPRPPSEPVTSQLPRPRLPEGSATWQGDTAADDLKESVGHK